MTNGKSVNDDTSDDDLISDSPRGERREADPWSDFKSSSSEDERGESGRLETAEDVIRFIFAGKATLTVLGTATKTRFTFRVSIPPPYDDGRTSTVKFFVSVLDGPDNESNYRYLGNVFKKPDGWDYAWSKKSRIAEDAPSSKCFGWFFDTVIKERRMHPRMEVWHEGRCGRCGMKLTVPESIRDGIGPECRKKMGRDSQ